MKLVTIVIFLLTYVNVYGQSPVQIAYPNGGEVRFNNTADSVTWTGGVSANVKIELSKNNGGTWEEFISSTPNNSIYNFTWNTDPGRNYRFRVTELDSSFTSDISNTNFTVAGVEITSPNSDPFYPDSSKQLINWTYTGDSTEVKFQYSTNDGGAWIDVQSYNPAGDSSIVTSWTVPLIGSNDNGKIRFITSQNSKWEEDVRFSPRPDFAITNFQVQIENDTIIYTADITNNGGSASGVKLLFVEENRETYEVTELYDDSIATFTGGSSFYYRRAYEPSNANTFIYATLDPFNRFIETDETNNRSRVTFSTNPPKVYKITSEQGKNFFTPDEFGTFISGVAGQQNEFEAFVQSEVAIRKVDFTIVTEEGTQLFHHSDTDSTDGWTASLDLGSLQYGDHSLLVRAVSTLGVPSTTKIKLIKIKQLPSWIRLNDNIWTVRTGAWGSNSVNFQVYSSIPFNFEQGIADVNEALPAGKIKVTSELTVDIVAPLPSHMQWSLSGNYRLAQNTIGHTEYFSTHIQTDVAGVDSLVALSYYTEFQKLLRSFSKSRRIPIKPGVDAILESRADIIGHLQILGVLAFVDNHIQFVRRNDGKTTEFNPGLEFRLALSAGVEILWGLAKAWMVMTPTLFTRLVTSILTYPEPAPGICFDVDGRLHIDWALKAEIFWGFGSKTWTVKSGRWGPWQVFDESLGCIDYPNNSVTYTMRDSLELPSTLPLPTITADKSGNVMIAFLAQDENGNPQIYYSFKSAGGEFSAPAAITKAATFKTDPNISFNADGTANAVWTQNSQPRSFLEEDPEIEEILRYQDIYYSFWDKENWSEPVNISGETPGSERGDGVSVVAASPDSVGKLVLYSRNTNVDANDRSSLEIYFAELHRDSIVNSGAVTTNSAADLMVKGTYLNENNALAIWLNKESGNADSILTDYEIYFSNYKNSVWTSPAKLTNNSVKEVDLSVAALKDGKALAAWVEVQEDEDSLGNILFNYVLRTSVFDTTANTWSVPDSLHSDPVLIETPTVQIDNRNIATVTWRGYGNSINGDLMVTTKDYSRPGSWWRSPVSLTDDEFVDWMSASAIDSSNNMYVVSLKSSTAELRSRGKSAEPNFFGNLNLITAGIRENGSLGDTLSYLIEADLGVDSSLFAADESTFRAGQPSSVDITIKNYGAKYSTPVIMKAYLNDPDNGGIQIGDDIQVPEMAPEEEFTATVNPIMKETTRIYVVIDPDNTLIEQSKENNKAFKMYVLYPDLTVTGIDIDLSAAPAVGDAGNVTVTVRNTGQKKANFVNVALYDSAYIEVNDNSKPVKENNGDDDAEHIDAVDEITPTLKISSAESRKWAEFTIQTMAPDSDYVYTLPYNVINKGTNLVYAVIDSINFINELDETNNSDTSLFYVYPDLQVESMWYDDPTRQMYTVISNVGGDTAFSFITSFHKGDPYGDPAKVIDIMTDALPHGEIDTLQFTYLAPNGAVNAYSWIDSLNLVRELDKTNNRDFIIVVSDGIKELNTELLKNGVIYPDTMYEYPVGYELKIPFSINNIGTLPTENVAYEISKKNLDGSAPTSITSGSVAYLDGESSFIDTLTLILSDTAAFRLFIEVDPANAIAEFDDTDNIDSAVVKGYDLQTHSMYYNSGWNMISSYIRPVNDTVSVLFAGLSSDTVVVKNPLGLIYWPNVNINQIRNWNFSQGYQLFVSRLDSIEFNGKLVDPERTFINLSQGWNLISYLRNTPMNLISAWDNILSKITIAKDGFGRVYWPQFNINTIGNLDPGNGYQLYMSQPGVLTYPSNAVQSMLAKGNELTKVQNPVYYPILAKNTGNSSVLLIQSEQLQNGDEIAVWSEDNRLIGTAAAADGKAIITVWGDNPVTEDKFEGAMDGEELRMTIYSSKTHREKSLKILSSAETISNQSYAEKLIYKQNGFFTVETEQIPDKFALYQNYPNPFNPSTIIKYSLPADTKVTLEIFDAIGQRVEILVNEIKPAGFHEIHFSNPRLASGVYFYRIHTNAFTETKKMMILK